MNIKEPENRPRERIEQLLSSGPDDKNRRAYERIPVEPGTEVYLPIICKGEVMDISDRGLSIRFKPSESPSLAEHEHIPVTLITNTLSFKIPTDIRRMDSRFGVIVLGLEFDPEEVEVTEVDIEPSEQNAPSAESAGNGVSGE